MEDLTQNSEEMKLTTISSLIAQIHTEATNYLDTKLQTEGLSKLATSHGFIIFTLSRNKDEETSELKPMTMSEIAQKVGKDKAKGCLIVSRTRIL